MNFGQFNPTRYRVREAPTRRPHDARAGRGSGIAAMPRPMEPFAAEARPLGRTCFATAAQAGTTGAAAARTC